jgi:hypothetical protein
MSDSLPAIGTYGPGGSLFDVHDRSLTQLRIPPALLRQLREVDEFKPLDFQLDGVECVNEDGTHSETPQTVRPGFEWQKYGTPATGLQWRQVPVDDTVEVSERLDPQTMAMQKRMSERAFHAYRHGGGGYMGDRMLEESFIVPDKEKDRRIKALQKSREVHGELRDRIDAAKVSCAHLHALTACFIRPLTDVGMLGRRHYKQGSADRCCGPCIHGST